MDNEEKRKTKLTRSQRSPNEKIKINARQRSGSSDP